MLFCWCLFTPPTRTRQDCLVLSCRCRRTAVWKLWTELQTSQDCRRQKISKMNMFSFYSIVLSRNVELDKILQSQIYWGLLKTVLSCRQFSSHYRHRQDKTRQDSPALSVAALWTIGISDSYICLLCNACHLPVVPVPSIWFLWFAMSVVGWSHRRDSKRCWSYGMV